MQQRYPIDSYDGVRIRGMRPDLHPFNPQHIANTKENNKLSNLILNRK